MSLSDATRAVSVLAELAPSGERNGRTRHHVTDRALLPLDAFTASSLLAALSRARLVAPVVHVANEVRD